MAQIDQKTWEKAYLSEIGRIGAETEGRILRSVFFGGGTPSMMDPGLVDAILTQVRATWPIANDIEITLEANPTSVEAGRFAGYRDAGVNRISMGIQALNDIDLKALGRLHSAREAMAAYETARSVFDRVSFDLIYARQGQTLSAWENELRQALDLAIDHLSLYQLTIENGTAFGDRYAAGKLRDLPDEDLSADMYALTQEVCKNAGLAAYEVSNHARSGCESVHNMIYWRYGDYAGIGPGAHGRLTLNGMRYATEAPLAPAVWLKQVSAQGCGESLREALLPEDEIVELLLMGMRLDQGVAIERLNLDFNTTLLRNIKSLQDLDLVRTDAGMLRLSEKGRPLLNAVITEMLRD